MPTTSNKDQKISDNDSIDSINIQVMESISVSDNVAANISDEERISDKNILALSMPIKTSVFSASFSGKIVAIAGAGILISSLLQILMPGKITVVAILSFIPVFIFGLAVFIYKKLKSSVQTDTN